MGRSPDWLDPHDPQIRGPPIDARMPSTACRCHTASTANNTSANARLPITSDQDATAKRISDSSNAICISLLTIHVTIAGSSPVSTPTCPAFRRIRSKLAQLPVCWTNLYAEYYWTIFTLNAQESTTMRCRGEQDLSVGIE